MNPVVWYSPTPETTPRLYWDQGTLQSLVDGWWLPGGTSAPTEWDVAAPNATQMAGLGRLADHVTVVIPGRFAVEHVDRINADLAAIHSVLVIVTTDEESLFPWWNLAHPRLRLWVQTPKVATMLSPPGEVWPERWLCEGAPTDVHRLADHAADAADRALDWVFAGQVTHPRRHAMARTFRSLAGGYYRPTVAFGTGLDYAQYLRVMAGARVVPCPGGPVTPDSFRIWEALEAGAVPIADTVAGNDTGHGYFEAMFGRVPFPVIEDWADARRVMVDVLADWQWTANRCQAWWLTQKRQMAYGLAGTRTHGRPADDITVMISTSPHRHGSDLGMLAETIASVRAHLPGVEILVLCDGVRPEQRHLGDAYAEYVRRICWAAAHEWTNVLPIVADRWCHQGVMARRAMDHVHTRCVLFAEHDTPLLDREVPWADLVGLVESDMCRVVRLYHEGQVPTEHRGLHNRPETINGVPVMRTRQWSQRPHLAAADHYRRWLHEFFGDESRTMVEDVMHGVCAGNPERYRVAIYAPDGDMRRSGHTDGRGGADKFPMVYEYPDGATPPGAPRAMSERVEP